MYTYVYTLFIFPSHLLALYTYIDHCPTIENAAFHLQVCNCSFYFYKNNAYAVLLDIRPRQSNDVIRLSLCGLDESQVLELSYRFDKACSTARQITAVNQYMRLFFFFFFVLCCFGFQLTGLHFLLAFYCPDAFLFQ